MTAALRMTLRPMQNCLPLGRLRSARGLDAVYTCAYIVVWTYDEGDIRPIMARLASPRQRRAYTEGIDE